jgi:hypothetical protein
VADQSGSPRDLVVRFDEGRDWRGQAQAVAPLIARVLGLGQREELTVSEPSRSAEGLDGIRYWRAWAGVPVEAGDVFIDLGRDGRIVNARCYVGAPIELPTPIPALSREDAIRTMHELTNADPPPPGMEHHSTWQLMRTDLQVFGVDRPPLLVWNHRLSTRVKFSGAHVLLDAHTGAVVTGWPTGCTTASPHQRRGQLSLLPPG